MAATQWEYHTLKQLPGGFFGGKVDENGMRAELNRLGAEGWELVSSFATSYGEGTSREILFIFKRPRVGSNWG